MKKLIYISIFFSIILILNNNFKVFAETIVYRTTNRQYISQDSSLKVIETRDIVITKPDWRISSNSIEKFSIINLEENITEEKIQKTKASIKTLSTNTKILNITENENKSVITVDVEILDEVIYEKPIKIILEYTNFTLQNSYGLVTDIYIPGFSNNYQFKTANSSEEVITELLIPKNLPNINFVSLPHHKEDKGSHISIKFFSSDLIGKTAWVQIGTTQQYKFKLSQKIPKSIDLPIGVNLVKMIIPGDRETSGFAQKTYYSSISPETISLEIDSENNLIATFKIKSNQDTIIVLEGFIQTTVDIENNKGKESLFIDKNKYLKPALYWESNSPELIQFATEIKSLSLTNSSNLLITLYNEIVNRIDYSKVKKYGLNERQGALATLQGAAAVCMEYSDLLIATARALGIPARAAFGYGFSGSSDTQLTVEPHQWTELFWEGKWVAVDTTWGESGREIIGGRLNHIYTHVAYIDPNTPPTLSINSIGNITFIESMTYEILAYSGNIPANLMTPTMLLNKYLTSNNFSQNYIVLLINDILERTNARLEMYIYDVFNFEIKNTTEKLGLFFVSLITLIYISKKLKPVKNRKINYESPNQRFRV
jgi:hypothetical protein